MKKWTAMLVSHTHWDREWYMAFQGFRRNLVLLTDRLLSLLENKPRYKYFVFDGQTIVLEDYLEIRPENEAKIGKFVREGRLQIGPWYVLPDEFLVSGESLVRNLLMGHQIGEKFGKVMKVGYAPDSFGHIAQLPQILRGFGIDSFVFMRGLGDEWEKVNTEFWWEGLDGSRVLAIFQLREYLNAAKLGYELPIVEAGTMKVNMDKAVKTIRNEVDALSRYASTPYLLLNNGGDHHEPQPEIPDIIDYVNSKLDDVEVVHATFEDLINKIREESPQLGTIRGELHRGRYHPILLGVFSSRNYLKQQNFLTQVAIEKYVEPLSSIAWLLEKPYEGTFLRYAWKHLISNHSHDSIGGCSIDDVHRDMLHRFAAVRQIAEILSEESARFITKRINTQKEGAKVAIVVFNPQSWRVTDVANVHLEFPNPPNRQIHNFVVRDKNGKIVASQLKEVCTDKYTYPDNQQLWGTTLSILAEDVSPLGYKTYYIEETEDDKRVFSPLETTEMTLENTFLKVEVQQNGSLNITDKRSGHTFKNCNLFEDTEDVGDEYNYSPAMHPHTITSVGERANISLVDKGPVSATLKVETIMQLPEGINEERTSRSNITVPCPITSYVTLHAYIPRVEIKTVIDNKAKDHRLRTHFPSSLHNKECLAESQFGLLKRNIKIPEGKGWVEKPVGTKAMQSFVAVESGGKGLCLVSEGLPEYEAIDTPSGVDVVLTLVRSVGWLSRDDLITRPHHAGPKIPTPDAQCIGKHIFRYALIPFINRFEEAKPWVLANQFKAPLKSIVTSLNKGSLPDRFSFMEISPQELVLSALKKAEKEEVLIARFYNIASYEVRGKIVLYKTPRKVTLANLAEEDINELPPKKELDVKVEPFQIITLKLAF